MGHPGRACMASFVELYGNGYYITGSESISGIDAADLGKKGRLDNV